MDFTFVCGVNHLFVLHTFTARERDDDGWLVGLLFSDLD